MLKKIISWLCLIGLLMAISFSIGSIVLEKNFLVAHLLVHFQLQYAIVALLCVIGLYLTKKWIIASLGLSFILVLYFALLHPINFFPQKIDNIDIFYINSHYSNEDVTPIVNAVKDYNPETIAFVEANPLIVGQMADNGFTPVLNHRAYASSCTIYTSNFEAAEVEGQTHLPLCIIHYENFDLITIHAHRPMKQENIDENLAFFDELKSIIDSYEQNNQKFIIVGDFNSSLYSTYFRERFGQYVHSNTYTWLTNTIFALPIDHVISNMNIEYTRSPNLGSDHRALLIKFND